MDETTEPSYPAQLPLDGRRWWGVCGGDADERLVCARTARTAIAAVKRAWIAGDRANGASLAHAIQTASTAGWKTVGPFTTPQAYHRARRQMLWEATESWITGSVRAQDVDSHEVMVGRLGERRLADLEAKIVRLFTDPGTVIV